MASIAAVAVGLWFVVSWSTYGALIGPASFLVAILLTVVSSFIRKTLAGKTGLRLGLGLSFLTLTLYLTFGPACWAMARFNTPDSQYPSVTRLFFYVYQPVATNAIFAPEPIRSASMSYMSFWMPQNVQFHDWGLGIGWSVPGWTYTIVHY
jgi:hypothetical protein